MPWTPGSQGGSACRGAMGIPGILHLPREASWGGSSHGVQMTSAHLKPLPTSSLQVFYISGLLHLQRCQVPAAPGARGHLPPALHYLPPCPPSVPPPNPTPRAIRDPNEGPDAEKGRRRPLQGLYSPGSYPLPSGLIQKALSLWRTDHTPNQAGPRGWEGGGGMGTHRKPVFSRAETQVSPFQQDPLHFYF